MKNLSMKPISQIATIIIIITGFVNSLHAQQLASEKQAASFYSKATQQKLQARYNDRQPAALNARQDLPSQKAVQQPAVPAQIQPAKIRNRQIIKPGKQGHQQLASERPVDMDKINRQRSKRHGD